MTKKTKIIFSFVTLFPNLIEPYFQDSILKRAIEANLIDINFYNPRDFSKNPHKKVDNYKAGGGAGLLLSPQPLFDTLNSIKERYRNPYFIFPTPVGIIILPMVCSPINLMGSS